MQPPTSTPDRWHFSHMALPPVVLAIVAAIIAVSGFVLWSTNNIDERADEQQTTMIARVIEGRLSRVIHELASVSISDEAVLKTGPELDIAWIDKSVGNWLTKFFGHDRTIVLDANDEPVYVMANGAMADIKSFESMAGHLRPLLARLRAIGPGQRPDRLMGQRPPDALSTPPSGTKPLRIGTTLQRPPPPPPPLPPPSVTDFAIVDGMPAIVAAMVIIPESPSLRQPQGTEQVIMGIQFLDRRAAEQIDREFLFEDGHFSLTRGSQQDQIVYPILSQNGRIIAFFEWKRNRLGQLMLRQTGPVLFGAFIIAGMLIFLLLRQVRRSSAAIETARLLAVHQANHDALTGLHNRMSFDAYLADAVRDNQNGGARLTLFMLDLDRFKQVNDTLGHQAGDELICTVGDRLRAIFGSHAMIARLGGDEFAILMISQEVATDISEVSSRVIEAIGLPFTLGHFKAHVGVSIGIVIAHGDEVDPTELVRKADIALYEAKASGRNRAVVYEEHMNELLQLQHTIEAELREALGRDDQLTVVFQPLIDQKTRKVIGAEALSRWYHPKFGQISPTRFIPVAENTGLIENLGDFVLRRACELGATAPGRTIAVNISPTQLRNPRFSDLIFDILHQTGMRPADLELEITESILLDDEHVSSKNLRTFRTAGIQIALDDFGTGYSSLSYLKRYPVDRIKIDRSFVSQLSPGHVSVAITNAMVTLAHAMELEVTAEGVETEEQVAILGTLGCNTLQGFLFSGGVSATKITEIFAAPENALPEQQYQRPLRAAEASR